MATELPDNVESIKEDAVLLHAYFTSAEHYEPFGLGGDAANLSPAETAIAVMEIAEQHAVHCATFRVALLRAGLIL